MFKTFLKGVPIFVRLVRRFRFYKIVVSRRLGLYSPPPMLEGELNFLGLYTSSVK